MWLRKTAAETVGCEWCYALLAVKARNDADGAGYENYMS